MGKEEIAMPFVRHPGLPGKVFVRFLILKEPGNIPAGTVFPASCAGKIVAKSAGERLKRTRKAQKKEIVVTTSEIYDLIIVGGGPGGFSAGIYAMRAALKTILIEKGAPGGQMAMSGEVENYPGIERIGGPDLSMQFQQHALPMVWKWFLRKSGKLSRDWHTIRCIWMTVCLESICRDPGDRRQLP